MPRLDPHIVVRLPNTPATRSAVKDVAALIYKTAAPGGAHEDVAAALQLAVEPEQLERAAKALTLGELASWVKETGVSLHISVRDGKFLLVGHVASGTNAHANADITDRDLERGLKILMTEF